MDATTYLYFTFFTPLVYFIFLSPFLAASTTNQVSSALVTTTAGIESSTHHHHSNSNRPIVPLTRPTNLFNQNVRGAVNFSYRPQIDDDELLDNEDEFANSFGSFTGGALHFDHYDGGPYAQQQQQQHGSHGYLVYGGNGNRGIPRDFSTFSIQTTASNINSPNVSGLLENQNIDLNRSEKNRRDNDDQSKNDDDDISFIGKYCIATLRLPTKNHLKRFPSINPTQNSEYLKIDANINDTWKQSLLERWLQANVRYPIANGICLPSVCETKFVGNIIQDGK